MKETTYRKIIAALLLLAAIVFLVCCIYMADTRIFIAIGCLVVTGINFYKEMQKK